MNKRAISRTALFIAIAGIAQVALAQAPRPETPALRKDDYRLKLEEVIVIGQDPYWRRQGQPRWDRPKVDVDLKPKDESRLQLFPNYTAEERDESMKIKDRKNATPQIKIFERKF